MYRFKATECFKLTKSFYKESGKLHLAFHNLLNYLHLTAKYLNKVRKAKKRQFEDIEQEKVETKPDRPFNKNSTWVTNLFSTKPQSDVNDEKIKAQDDKLLKFYDQAISNLKSMILALNIVAFEKSYIDVIHQLNIRKFCLKYCFRSNSRAI